MNPAIFLPDAQTPIPGFDPYWETRPLHIDVGTDGSSIDQIALPIGDGETVPWTCFLALGGDTSCTITVWAPPNSNGGFSIQGYNASSVYTLKQYGADQFGTATSDTWKVGISGTLEGWAPIWIDGIVRGPAGLLRVTTSAGTMKSGSIVRNFRIFDSRAYGVAG